jgi:hypothetical protein
MKSNAPIILALDFPDLKTTLEIRTRVLLGTGKERCYADIKFFS